MSSSTRNADHFLEHLNKFNIKLEDSALNYLTSMLAVLSANSDIRESTEMILEEAEVDSERMDTFYATLGTANMQASTPSKQRPSYDNPVPATPADKDKQGKGRASMAARRQRRTQKKAATDESVITEVEPTIIATSQQSRFHRETLETISKDIDLADVNISVNQLDLLVDAHLKLKEGVRYGLIGQNGVGKTVLMKCMADNILAMPQNLNILHITQLETFDELTVVLNEVLDADKTCKNALWEFEELHRVLGKERQSTAKNTAELNRVVHRILLSRLRERLEYARHLAIKRSGTRGHEARQQQLKLEKEYSELEVQNAQTFITSRMTADLLTEIFDKYELINLEARAAKARKILKGLGFSADQTDAPVKTLSGGWRMKIALAKSLFLEPNILFLDEPTNHLDLPAILWLQEYLINETEGLTVVVVSHDREFLNAVTDETIILRDKTLKYHPGNFDDYEKNSEEQRIRKQTMLDTQEKKRAKIVASIQHNVQQAKSTGDDKRLGQVASRKKKLERLGMEKTEDGKRFKVSYWAGYHDGAREKVTVEQAVKTAPIKIPVPEPLRFHGSTFTAKDTSFKYPGTQRNVIENFSIDIKTNDRIAFLGPNGCGKTTLLNMLTGQTKPTKGEVYRHPLLRIGYFSQHIVDQLDHDCTPVEDMMKRYPGLTEHECRAQFGTVGITGNTVLRKTRNLSGGQRNRIALALVLQNAPHVLVLDEITNHLDMGTVEKLVDALKEFTGTLILVSHDVWFLKQLMEEEEDDGDGPEEESEFLRREFYIVKNGQVGKWESDMDAYVETVMRQVRKAR